MSTDQPTTTRPRASSERMANKAEKLGRTTARTAKQPPELIGRVDAIVLDLEADGPTNLRFTLAPKDGANKTIAIAAEGEVRQSAISLLSAAQFARKKLSVTLRPGTGNIAVASIITLKSKPRAKD